MEIREIEKIASYRAYIKIKRYTAPLLYICVILYLIAIWVNSMWPILVGGIICIGIISSALMIKTKMVKEFIKDKQEQVITEEDYRGKAKNKINKTKSDVALNFLVCLIAFVPSISLFSDTVFPLCVRFPLAIFAVVSGILYLKWYKNKVNKLKDILMKENNS